MTSDIKLHGQFCLTMTFDVEPQAAGIVIESAGIAMEYRFQDIVETNPV